jgi:hypothetical protein
MAPFVDEHGRFTSWPVKQPLQREIIEWLAQRFEPGRAYSERQANEILDSHHTFGDAALLRRMLYDLGYLDRERDGSRYWRSAASIQNPRSKAQNGVALGGSA